MHSSVGSGVALRRPAGVNDQAGAEQRAERADRDRVERVEQRIDVGTAGQAEIDEDSRATTKAPPPSSASAPASLSANFTTFAFL